MATKTIETVTIKEATERLGISRNNFYDVYRGRVTEIPTTGGVCLFDWESILLRRESYKLEKKNKSSLKTNLIKS